MGVRVAVGIGGAIRVGEGLELENAVDLIPDVNALVGVAVGVGDRRRHAVRHTATSTERT